MRKMSKKLIAGTAFAVTAAVLAGCTPQSNLYGPPSTEDETTIRTEGETTVQAETRNSFDVTSEIQEDVYGPPEWFE